MQLKSRTERTFNASNMLSFTAYIVMKLTLFQNILGSTTKDMKYVIFFVNDHLCALILWPIMHKCK